MSMRDIPFSFGNGLNHFRNTGGPKGFVWKFALSYAAVMMVMQVCSMWLQWPLYETYGRVFTEGEGNIAQYTDEIQSASMRANLASLLMIPIWLGMWAVFEAAQQRRFMRGEGFKLQFGADEGRLLLVGLIWGGMMFAAYIALIVMMIVPVIILAVIGTSGSGAIIAVILVSLFALIGLGGFIWLVAKMSAASALTIRDETLRFFESFRVTRGKTGVLFGTIALQFLVILIASLIFYGVLFALGYGAVGDIVADIRDGSATADDMLAVLRSPGFLGAFAVLGFVWLAIYAVLAHIFAGPPALAAKTDPTWVGQAGVTNVFS